MEKHFLRIVSAALAISSFIMVFGTCLGLFNFLILDCLIYSTFAAGVVLFLEGQIKNYK